MPSFEKRVFMTPVLLLGFAHLLYLLMVDQPDYRGHWLFKFCESIVHGFWFLVGWSVVLGLGAFLIFKAVQFVNESDEAAKQRLEAEEFERRSRETNERMALVTAARTEQERLRQVREEAEREERLKEIVRQQCGPRSAEEAMKHAMDDINSGGIGL